MVDSHCPYCALQCAMTMEPVGLGTAGLEGRPRTASHLDEPGLRCDEGASKPGAVVAR
mgnify:CR=1 FL=1